ncbi:CAF1 family ribonuclease [Oesophagostomum dentatum]|uniref:poly(A)-specific ribonuclease n=1 Tax=Oesophagostomum dentatum TaxID=61180 RepID=A0A0B1S0Y2_OESDE|nr:CAF1 family ribonuclease [Oesophagostomum dentatum]
MSGNQEVRIHDVWNSNVEEEFAKMRTLIEDYPFVAMDTEFPGVVATPLGTFKSKEDFNYQQVSCNVNMLKLIQVCLLRFLEAHFHYNFQLFSFASFRSTIFITTYFAHVNLNS